MPDYFKFERFEDVQALVDAGQQEQIDLEFKSEPWCDRRELAKDISAMANAQGGHILVGVVEAGVPPDGEHSGPSKAPKVASAIKPVEAPDTEKGRIEQWCAGYTAPRLVPHVYALTDGASSVLVVRVPRSQHAPHMVTDQKEYRYWVRVGARAEIMTDEEIRRAIRRTDRAFTDAKTKLAELEDAARLALKRFNGKPFISLAAVPAPPIPGNVDIRNSQVRALLHDADLIQCGAEHHVKPTLEGLGAPLPRGDRPPMAWGEIHRDGTLLWHQWRVGGYEGNDQVCGYVLACSVDYFLAAAARPSAMSGDQYPYLFSAIVHGVGGWCFWAAAGDERPVDRTFRIDQPLSDRTEVAIRRELAVDFDRDQVLRETSELLWNAWGYENVPAYIAEGRPPWRTH